MVFQIQSFAMKKKNWNEQTTEQYEMVSVVCFSFFIFRFLPPTKFRFLLFPLSSSGSVNRLTFFI